MATRGMSSIALRHLQAALLGQLQARLRRGDNATRRLVKFAERAGTPYFNRLASKVPAQTYQVKAGLQAQRTTERWLYSVRLSEVLVV